MAKVLKGLAWPSGQIEFKREDNEWAFKKITAGLKNRQEDVIRVNPSIATFQLERAPTTRSGGAEIDWLEEQDRLLKTADRVYLDFRGDFLRFRRAVHDASESRRFITLGSRDAADDFTRRKIGKVKYFFASRREASLFTVESLVNFGEKAATSGTDEIECPIRVETNDNGPTIVFSTSGAHAPMEMVEWRSSVKPGDRGRFHMPGNHVVFRVSHFVRPVTVLREHRAEFNNYSYTLAPDKIREKLDQWVNKRLARLV